MSGPWPSPIRGYSPAGARAADVPFGSPHPDRAPLILTRSGSTCGRWRCERKAASLLSPILMRAPPRCKVKQVRRASNAAHVSGCCGGSGGGRVWSRSRHNTCP